MTKVEIHYELQRALDERLMDRIAEAHGIYGIFRVTLVEGSKEMVVSYDASRLTPAQVTAALQRAGLPVLPKPALHA